MSERPSGDSELARVRDVIMGADPGGARFGRVLRETIDQLLDGQHTGRFRWSDLYKTEKTHAGTLVEINLQREFAFDNGEQMDYTISSVDVDCKFSQTPFGWEIPPEAWHAGCLCLVVTANDQRSEWSAGLIRADDAYLGAANRDLKRKLTREGRERVTWIWNRVMELPRNVLLHLPNEDLDAIFGLRGGQQKVNELFRRAQGQVVGRAVIATVARQHDYMKRVRGNGGARSALRPEGILILGEYSAHKAIARDLGLPVPGPGEFVSANVVRDDHTRAASFIHRGERWRIAGGDDAVEDAPLIPIR